MDTGRRQKWWDYYFGVRGNRYSSLQILSQSNGDKRCTKHWYCKVVLLSVPNTAMLCRRTCDNLYLIEGGSCALTLITYFSLKLGVRLHYAVHPPPRCAIHKNLAHSLSQSHSTYSPLLRRRITKHVFIPDKTENVLPSAILHFPLLQIWQRKSFSLYPWVL